MADIAENLDDQVEASDEGAMPSGQTVMLDPLAGPEGGNKGRRLAMF